jgi:hypothetical protein
MVTLRIIMFLDCVHHPEFWKLEDTMFWKVDVSALRCGGEMPTLLGPLERD